MSPETPLLHSLLGPVGVQTFVRDFWERAALFLPGSPDRFAPLEVDRRRFQDRLIHSRKLKIGFLDPRGDHRELPIGAELAGITEAGPTLCAGGIEAEHPALRRLIAEVKRGLGHAGRVSVNAYLSSHGGGFGMHLDAQAVFILQIEGCKRWTFGRQPVVDWPEMGTAPAELEAWNERFPDEPLAPPAPETLDEVILRPGDALFLPAGTWHQAQAEGPSFALTLSMVPLSFLDFALDLLDRQEEAAEDWRAGCPPVWAWAAPPDRCPEAVEGWMQARITQLRAALRALRPEEIDAAWRARIG